MSTVIGPSVSEPHTSVTSLRACVCTCTLACLLAWTDHIPEILNMRFHLHVRNSNSKRSMESSSSSCSSTPMGLPSVSTTMELLSAKDRLRLEREGRATARLHARVCSYSHALIQLDIHASTTCIERGAIDFNSIHCELPECKLCRFSHDHETHS